MPPKPKFTRDEIAAIAYQMIKEGGVSSLTARDWAAVWVLPPVPSSRSLKTWRR